MHLLPSSFTHGHITGAGSALFDVPKSAYTEKIFPHPPPPVQRYALIVSIMRTGPMRTHVPWICTTVPTSDDTIDDSVALQYIEWGGRRMSRARRGRGEYRSPV